MDPAGEADDRSRPDGPPAGTAPGTTFPIVKRPAPGTRTPVLVSVPHYGTEPLPHITRDDYREPRFETFA